MNKPSAEELKLLLREQELKLQAAAQDNFFILFIIIREPSPPC